MTVPLSGVVNKIPQTQPRQSFNVPMDDQLTIGSVDQTAFAIISIDNIDVSPYQPRIKFSDESIASLAESISTSRQTTPITVRRKSDGRYELIGGERRLRACKMLQNKSIECIVRELDDAHAAIFSVIDNDSREDLSDYERGRSYKRLIEEGWVKTQSELAERIGVSPSTIARCLYYFRLPTEVLEMLDAKPDLLGNKVVNFFAIIHEKGYTEIVIRHVKSIFDGKFSQDAALSNAKNEIEDIENHDKKKQEVVKLLSLGKEIANLQIKGKRSIVIKCSIGISPQVLIKAIEKSFSTGNQITI